MSTTDPQHQDPAQGGNPSPDAVGRGTIGDGADAAPTLFVLAGPSLGATAIEGEGSPTWFDLRQVVGLDAIGDPDGGRQVVELSLLAGDTVRASWPMPFCDKVIERLRELLEAGEMTGADDAGGPPSVSERSRTDAVIEASATPGLAHVPPPEPLPEGGAEHPVGQTAVAPAAPPPPPVPPASPDFGATPEGEPPLPGDGPPLATAANAAGHDELVLHDVVYHGGYPGQAKRRKKCVVVLTAEGLAISGPAGPEFTLDWGVVNSVETQNSDEAKFRLNLRAKRNASVLVLECDQGVTILLEARDVPTLPLRGALSQLVGGRVVVA